MSVKHLKKTKTSDKWLHLKYKSFTLRRKYRMKLRRYMKREIELSTTHGLPYIVKEHMHWCERLFWATSFIFCLCLVYVLLSPLYARYKEAPTVTSVELDYFNWNISYPAITLCPDFKTDEGEFAYLVEFYKNKTGQDLSTYLWSISNVQFNTIQGIDLQTPEIISMIPAEEYAIIAEKVFVKFDEDHVTTNTDWPISLDSVMTEHGMCHVINSNIAEFDKPHGWRNPQNGKYEKNNIELSVHDGEFFIQTMDYADIYTIFIHSPDEIMYDNTPSYIHIKESYMSIGVQVSSTIMTDQVKQSTIDFRKCRMTNEPLTARYPIYSYNHCLIECRIRMAYKICGCIPHWYKPLPNEKICTLMQLSCVLEHRTELKMLSVSLKTLSSFTDTKDLPNSAKDCGCLINCEGTVYLRDEEFVVAHSSMTRVRIGISTFPKVRVIREEIFGLNDIILRSGGVINLCIGSSLISIMELIMTFIRPFVFITVRSIKTKFSIKVKRKFKTFS